MQKGRFFVVLPRDAFLRDAKRGEVFAVSTERASLQDARERERERKKTEGFPSKIPHYYLSQQFEMHPTQPRHSERSEEFPHIFSYRMAVFGEIFHCARNDEAGSLT
jgi:hypothetical protein